MRAIFVSPDEADANNPANITVSPRGGILLCEDGGARQDPDTGEIGGARLLGISGDGAAFPFDENNVLLQDPLDGKPFISPGDYRGSEFAGAAFSPDGSVLYVNIQRPG